MRTARVLRDAKLAALCLLALIARSSEASSAYDLEVVAQHTPSALQQREERDVRLVLANRGSVTWDPEKSFKVSYRWIATDGDVLVADGERTSLPRAVRPGETIDLRARLVAPTAAGVALLQWDVVEESVTWISQRDPTPATPVRIEIRPALVSHAFTVLEQELPRFVTASEWESARLVVRNDGLQNWTAGRPIHVSYHWIHPDQAKARYDGERSVLPRAVGRGERVAVDVRVQVPPSPGIYRLQWDMVEEGVTWFSERDPSPESAALVLVLPQLTRAAAATIAALMALGIAFIAARRQPRRLVAMVALLDLVVLAVALLAKQAALTAELNAGGNAIGWLAAGTSVVLLVVFAFLPVSIRPWLALAANALASAVIFADLLHFRFFGDVLSFASAQSGGQLGSIGASVASLIRMRDLWLFVDLLPAIVLAFVMREPLRVAGAKPARVFACIVLPLLVPAALELRRHAAASEGPFAQVFQNKYVVAEAGVLNWHLYDAGGLLRAQMFRRALEPERAAEIEAWFRRTAPLRAGVEPWFGAARGRDLIMIQVESMQSFVIGYVVDGQEITPHLNRWRQTSLVASACADQTAQGRTSDGEFATQVSLLPLPKGAVAFRYATNRYRSIAGVLAAHGYRTLSAIPFDGAFWNRRVTHEQYGYQESLFEEAFRPGVEVGWGLNDRDFLLQMVPRLASQRRPFAALLITLSDHHPYDAFPDQLKTLRLGRLEGTRFGNYLHAMHYFDAAFGAFTAALEREGVLQNAVIALWGDHASGLRWKDLAPQIGHRATEAELYLTQAVPLMIDVRGVELQRVHDVPCGQIDVAPTILALLGVDPAPHPFLGRNLLGVAADIPIAQQYTVWRDREHLFLPRGPDAAHGLCYELPSMREIAGDACRDGYDAARMQVQISRDVIRYDLQTAVGAGSAQ
jgi:lipoteichoic acid synthase